MHTIHTPQIKELTEPQEPIYAWHFLRNSEGKDYLLDGTEAPADNTPLEFSGKPFLCRQGLHASLSPYDAMTFDKGTTLCYVKCEGEIIHSKAGGKLVCTKRTILARMDAKELLAYSSRMFALSVVHLWNAPDVVYDWLMTGEEEYKEVVASATYAAYATAASASASAATSAATYATYASAYAATTTYAYAAAAEQKNREFFDSLVFSYFFSEES